MLGFGVFIGFLALASASLNHGLYRRVNMCGTLGYDLGIDAYYYMEDASLSSPTQCGTRCVSDPECKTFAVGNGACMLYNTTMQVI
jgi:hypothetical protein